MCVCVSGQHKHWLYQLGFWGWPIRAPFWGWCGRIWSGKRATRAQEQGWGFGLLQAEGSSCLRLSRRYLNIDQNHELLVMLHYYWYQKNYKLWLHISIVLSILILHYYMSVSIEKWITVHLITLSILAAILIEAWTTTNTSLMLIPGEVSSINFGYNY